jgi:hypothetical protein
MSRWCMGLPFTTIRPATPDELNRYTAELKNYKRRLKRQGWLLGLSAGAAALVSFAYVNQERGVPGNAASLLFFSAIAIALGVTGVAGSIGEVLFGRRFSRILFSSAIVGIGLSLSFSGTRAEFLGTCSGFLILIGGNAMLMRQIQERRQMKKLVHNLDTDIQEKIAWRFEREFPTGDDENPTSRYSVEVFPRSNVALAINETAPGPLTIRSVTEVTSSGTGAIDAPLRTFEPLAGQESLDFRQRHFTSDEKDELKGLLRRDLRALTVRSLILLWASLALAGAVDAQFNHHPLEPTATSVLLGTVMFFVLEMKHISAWLRIRSDWRGDVLVVIRPQDPKLEGMALEQLPRSGMVWSRFGAPSPWRTKRKR